MSDDDHLHQAFESVFLDLCNHGICKYDHEILQMLWVEFMRDMLSGFPSLSRMQRHDNQQ